MIPHYREAGISVFVMACFVADDDGLRGIREAAGVPLRVVRLSVPFAGIEMRLATDVTTERQEELREAAEQIAAGAGVGIEDVVVANDRRVAIVAQQIMAWPGWPVTRVSAPRSSRSCGRTRYLPCRSGTRG